MLVPVVGAVPEPAKMLAWIVEHTCQIVEGCFEMVEFRSGTMMASFHADEVGDFADGGTNTGLESAVAVLAP